MTSAVPNDATRRSPLLADGLARKVKSINRVADRGHHRERDDDGQPGELLAVARRSLFGVHAAIPGDRCDRRVTAHDDGAATETI